MKEESPAPVAREGPIGNSPVHNHQTAARSFGLPVKHRPDLGFKNYDRAGTNPPQHPPHCKDIVDGRVEDSVRERCQSLVGDVAAGYRRDGNIQRNAGSAIANFAEQSSGGDDFAYRNRVQPNCARGRRVKQCRLGADAFGELTGISRIPYDTVNEIEYKQRKCGGASHPVKDLNESALNIPGAVHGRAFCG